MVTGDIRWDDLTFSFSKMTVQPNVPFNVQGQVSYLYHNDAIKPHDTNIKFRHPQIKYLISSWHFRRWGPLPTVSCQPRTFSLQTEPNTGFVPLVES